METFTYKTRSRFTRKEITREIPVAKLQAISKFADSLRKRTKAQLLDQVGRLDPVCAPSMRRDKTLSKADIVGHILGRTYSYSTLSAWGAWLDA